ncbi:hypothetical protein [Bradyrhizobium sacchari]|uniref:hypothetical protein n=1 Tax=Bradyrhizobium sacchari TaxID=1399419 RepID=UPI0011A76966|nr:hypothetical protein [Bradyrhizobium sacchari]
MRNSFVQQGWPIKLTEWHADCSNKEKHVTANGRQIVTDGTCPISPIKSNEGYVLRNSKTANINAAAVNFTEAARGIVGASKRKTSHDMLSPGISRTILWIYSSTLKVQRLLTAEPLTQDIYRAMVSRLQNAAFGENSHAGETDNVSEIVGDSDVDCRRSNCRMQRPHYRLKH